jgi:cyanate permease
MHGSLCVIGLRQVPSSTAPEETSLAKYVAPASLLACDLDRETDFTAWRGTLAFLACSVSRAITTWELDISRMKVVTREAFRFPRKIQPYTN